MSPRVMFLRTITVLDYKNYYSSQLTRLTELFHGRTEPSIALAHVSSKVVFQRVPSEPACARCACVVHTFAHEEHAAAGRPSAARDANAKGDTIRRRPPGGAVSAEDLRATSKLAPHNTSQLLTLDVIYDGRQGLVLSIVLHVIIENILILSCVGTDLEFDIKPRPVCYDVFRRPSR
ncbi:hypothetical protein EVAR_58925_1 [Eumeta japonica]|uniref:Uncharacterized protein n=1 Tax=Eumeta variegata TaxID=151549 RepID=A0A4C1Y7I5_EUMVA|nr:hypothetical protein EVAR_58925_1 [Eumeta japonica]